MIIGCIKLPDTYGYEYANLIATEFGMAGRIVEASNALAFYKIVVTHGRTVMEYVMASTQRFTFDKCGVEEIVSGARFENSKFVNLAPISMKLITPEFCDNFLFVETISYLLMFGGSHTVNSDRLLVEFSTPPNNLSSGFCTMCVDSMSNVISMNTLVELLNDDMEGLYGDLPTPTYTLELNKITSILKNKAMGKVNLCNLVSVNDVGVLQWLLESLTLARKFVMSGKYPLLPDREFGAIRGRFDILQNLVMTEPVCRECIKTPSVLNLSRLFPYVDRNYVLMVSDMAMQAYDKYDSTKYRILDSNLEYFDQLNIRDLVSSVMYSPASSLEMEIVDDTPVVKASNWFEMTHPAHYGGVSNCMYNMHRTLVTVTRGSYVRIKLSKNMLDEIRLQVQINNTLEHYYIPLWYYNLASPCALNEPLLKSMQQVFSKI